VRKREISSQRESGKRDRKRDLKEGGHVFEIGPEKITAGIGSTKEQNNSTSSNTRKSKNQNGEE